MCAIHLISPMECSKHFHWHFFFISMPINSLVRWCRLRRRRTLHFNGIDLLNEERSLIKKITHCRWLISFSCDICFFFGFFNSLFALFVHYRIMSDDDNANLDHHSHWYWWILIIWQTKVFFFFFKWCNWLVFSESRIRIFLEHNHFESSFQLLDYLRTLSWIRKLPESNIK